MLAFDKNREDMNKLRINCTDNEPTRVVAFSGGSNKLYSIT